MAIKEVITVRATAYMSLLLQESGYDVTRVLMGEMFFIASNKDSRFAVIISLKRTLKAARAGGNEGTELQKLLTMPVLQVNVYYNTKKNYVVMVAPSSLQLAKQITGRPEVSVETLPEPVDTSYVIDQLKDFDPSQEIAIRWSVKDVLATRPDLTPAEARTVLESVYLGYANEGVTSELLQAVSYRLFKERLLPCTVYPETIPKKAVSGLLNLATGMVMTEADFLDWQKNDGYTFINGTTGEVQQITGRVSPTPGDFTLPALGNKRFEAPEGYYGDFPFDTEDLEKLRNELEQARALPDASTKS